MYQGLETKKDQGSRRAHSAEEQGLFMQVQHALAAVAQAQLNCYRNLGERETISGWQNQEASWRKWPQLEMTPLPSSSRPLKYPYILISVGKTKQS